MDRYAWVTLATNDSYGLGAMILAYSLKKVKTIYPLVVMVAPDVSEPMREQLRSVFDSVKVVDVFDSKDEAHLALLRRPELGVTFTKIHCWRLTEYEKCVFLDADTLMVKNSDDLFERDEFSAAPDIGWPDCFNSGVFVFRPSQETFDKLLQMASNQGSFDGGDQGLLNQFFSDWATKDIKKHLPFVYNLPSVGFYSYLPALKQYGSQIRILHFIGPDKPWHRLMDQETMQMFSAFGLEQSPLPKHIMTHKFCEKLHKDVLSNLEYANGMSHLPLEVCRSKSNAVELPRSLRGTGEKNGEKNDFRQISVSHRRLFNVNKGDSGELLKLEFFVASAVSPDPESVFFETTGKELEERRKNGTEEVTGNNESERDEMMDGKIEENYEVVEEIERNGNEIGEGESFEGNGERFTKERREDEGKNAKDENRTAAKDEDEKGKEGLRSSSENEGRNGKTQNPDVDVKSPENPFNYEKFFPDEICINNYLERNVTNYQLFEKRERSQQEAARADFTVSTATNQNVNFISRFDDKKSDQQVRGLPRFLTIPENDSRQSGNCCGPFSTSKSSHGIKSCRKSSAKTGIAEEKDEREKTNDSITAKNYAGCLPTGKSAESTAEPGKCDWPNIVVPENRKFGRFDDRNAKASLPPFWTVQSNSKSELNRKYSMPKLKPLLPKQNSFSKSSASVIVPKVTFYTEFLMSSDYRDPIDLPKDEIGFVESLIRREAFDIKRINDDERASNKFGPLPYSLAGDEDTPEILHLPRKTLWQSNDPGLYDLKNCKRQMGNKPKAKENSPRKKKPAAFPLSRFPQTKTIESRRKGDKRKNDEKRKLAGREKNAGRTQKSERKTTTSEKSYDAVGRTDNVDVILKRLFDYSKNYLHYFFVETAERFVDPIKKNTSADHVIGEKKTLRNDVAGHVSNGCGNAMTESRCQMVVSSACETPSNDGIDAGKVVDDGNVGNGNRKRCGGTDANGGSGQFGMGFSDFRSMESARIPNGIPEGSGRKVPGNELVPYGDAVRWRRKFDEVRRIAVAGSGRENHAAVIPMPWTEGNRFPNGGSAPEMAEVNGAEDVGKKSETNRRLNNSNSIRGAKVVEKEMENGENGNGAAEEFDSDDGAGSGIAEAKKDRKRKSGKRRGGGIRNGVTVNGDVTEEKSLADCGRNPKKSGEMIPAWKIAPEEEEEKNGFGAEIVEFSSAAENKMAAFTESKILPEKSLLRKGIISEKLSENTIRSRAANGKSAEKEKWQEKRFPRNGVESIDGKRENGDAENLSNFQYSPEETVKFEKMKKIVRRSRKCEKNLLARINSVVRLDSPATDDAIEPVAAEETNAKHDVIKKGADYNMEAIHSDSPSATDSSTSSGFSSALEEYARRQDWESGNIDYMGKDSFDNIWMKISDSVAKKISEESGGNSEELEKSSKGVRDTIGTKAETDNQQGSGDVAPKPAPISTGIIPVSDRGGNQEADTKVEKQPETKSPVSPSSSEAEVTPTTTEKAPAAEERSEKDAVASEVPSPPEIISPKVSETSRPTVTESVPPACSAEPKTPLGHQVAITKTPPTPTDALEGKDAFEEKLENEKVEQSPEPKKTTSDSVEADKALEKDTAVVPYCDVFQSAKMSQAKETQSCHKKNVEEIIRKQSEAKTAQFPPIALPSSPTEVKSEPFVEPAVNPEVESREKSVETSVENQEPEPKLSRSNSMKEEGGKKRGVISKILEIVGVVPKERKESESEPSSDKEKTPQRSTSKKEEPPAKPDETPVETPTKAECETAIPAKETDQSSGCKKGKKKKAQTPKSAKGETDADEKEVSSGDVGQPSQADDSQKSKSASKSGKGESKKPEETKSSQGPTVESAEKKAKRQNAKISIPQRDETIPGTEVTSPTPPVESEGPVGKPKNVEMLTVDESIPETPPALPVGKEGESKGPAEWKEKGDVESGAEKAVENQQKAEKKSAEGNKDAKSRHGEAKSQKRGSQKQPPSCSPAGSDEVEEVKVTSEEERAKQKSQVSPSKLSDQILKSMPPPPRRKPGADSKTESTSGSGSDATEQERASAKGGQKGKGGEPVPPPRNRSKPSQEGSAKGKQTGKGNDGSNRTR